MSLSLRIIFIKLSQASILLPVFAGIKSYKNLTPTFRLLFYFFLLCIGFEVQASVMGKIYHNNMPGLHLFTVVEFLTFSLVYVHFFRDKRFLAAFIRFNAVIHVAIALADGLYVHSIWTVNILSRTYACTSMLCYALIYFYYMFSKDHAKYSSAHPMFLLNVGVMIYFGANELYFMLNRDLMNAGSFASKIGLCIHGALNMIANYLYAQSFLCFRRVAIS